MSVSMTIAQLFLAQAGGGGSPAAGSQFYQLVPILAMVLVFALGELLSLSKINIRLNHI